MGEVIGLDHKAVLGDIRLYTQQCDVKKVFELILKCFRIEQEFTREK